MKRRFPCKVIGVKSFPRGALLYLEGGAGVGVHY